MIDQTEDRNPVEILAEEFLDRRRRGEQATVQEYVRSHPHLTAEIQNLFPAMLAMEQFRISRLSSSGKPVELQIDGPTQLGDFRIIREIGRGGMGVVYEAEQQSLERRVAVKVFPKQILRNSRQLTRFHREARTAASLHHTNIVPVFGVGEHNGLHYYVMQRIEGIALDEIFDRDLVPTECSEPAAGTVTTQASANTCVGAGDITQEHTVQVTAASDHQDEPDSKPVNNPAANLTESCRDRCRHIALVGIQVADALAYAHGQGVLHRDIKPGNLLLDPQGTVWVTDFGLATVMNADPVAGRGDVAGTPRFMAPEHIGGHQNTCSDIYSLGVTLYELLTLQPAFEDKSRTALIQKILSGALVTPRAVRPDIPRDLQAIVMKAMALEPKHRYPDAESLAADLRRFTEGRPVNARQINVASRLWRWTRRSPAVAGLSACLVAVAVFSFILISSKWQDAVVESQRAEVNLSLALESMDQILKRFTSSWMANPVTTDTPDSDSLTPAVEFQIAVSDHSAAVLQDALKFYDRFAQQNATNPQLQRDTAKVHRRVADIYQRLGQYELAEQAYRRSLKILDPHETRNDAALAVEKASTMNQLGLTIYATSRFAEAEAAFRRAKTILMEAPQHHLPESQAELARTNNNLGQALWLLRRHDEARDCHRGAIALLENVVRQHSDNAHYRLALARAYRVYYPFALYGRRNRDHEQIRASGITILESLVQDFPHVPDYQCELSEMLSTSSGRKSGSRNLAREEMQRQRAVDLMRQLSQSHPTIPRYRAVLAKTIKELAETCSETDRDMADTLFLESVALYRSLVVDFKDIPTYHILLAMALQDHARNLRELGRLEDAIRTIQEGIDEQRTHLTLRPHSHFGTRMVSRLYGELAGIHRELGQMVEADQADQQSQEFRNRSGALVGGQ